MRTILLEGRIYRTAATWPKRIVARYSATQLQDDELTFIVAKSTASRSQIRGLPVNECRKLDCFWKPRLNRLHRKDEPAYAGSKNLQMFGLSLVHERGEM